jgi:hypothetical protein
LRPLGLDPTAKALDTLSDRDNSGSKEIQVCAAAGALFDGSCPLPKWCRRASDRLVTGEPERRRTRLHAVHRFEREIARNRSREACAALVASDSSNMQDIRRTATRELVLVEDRTLARLMVVHPIARLLNATTGGQARVCSLLKPPRSIARCRQSEWAEWGEMTLVAAEQVTSLSVITASRMVGHAIIKAR